MGYDLGQAGCGEQKPVEPALLPLLVFSAWPLTLRLPPYSRILMPKSWEAFVPRSTGLTGERKHGGLVFNYRRDTSLWRLLSFALGRDFHATAPWVDATCTKGKGLLCRARSAFPSLGGSHRTVLAQHHSTLSSWCQELPGACKWQERVVCSPDHRPVYAHHMVAPLPT